MENYMKVALESVLVGIATILLCMILVFIPVLNFLVLLFPVPIVVVAVRRGIWAGVGSLVTASVIIGILIQPFFGIILFSLSILTVLALWVVYKKKLQMNEAVILSAGGTLLSILISLQAFTLIKGESFFEFLLDKLKIFMDSNPANISRMVDLYQKAGIMDKAYSVDRLPELVIGQMRQMVPLLPSMLIIVSLLIGGLCFLVSRLVLKRFKIRVPHVPSFKNWTLPRGTGRGFFGLLLLTILGVWVRIPNFDVVLYTVSSLFTFIFTIQGMSVARFFLEVKKVPGIVSVLILIASFIILSMALTFMGIFDQMFGIRRAYAMKKES